MAENQNREINDGGESIEDVSSAILKAVSDSMSEILTDYTLLPRGFISIEAGKMDEKGLQILAVQEETRQIVSHGWLNFIVQDIIDLAMGSDGVMDLYLGGMAENFRALADKLEAAQSSPTPAP